jgi:hypothetical protein
LLCPQLLQPLLQLSLQSWSRHIDGLTSTETGEPHLTTGVAIPSRAASLQTAHPEERLAGVESLGFDACFIFGTIGG